MDNKGFGMNFVKIIKDRLIKNNGLLVVLSITATLFILGPSNVYIANVSDFTSPYMYILGEILKLFLYSSIILLFVLMIIPKKVYDIFISLLLGVAIALWVQGLFLTFDYGALDGNTKIDAFDIKGIVGATIWIAIIISAVIFRKFLHKFITPIFFVIIVSQLAIFIPNLFSNIDNIKGKTIGYPIFGPMSFSDKENIIYIVLDTFDAQFFEEASKDENYKDVFKDFTYFDNFASIDRWTAQSGVAALVGTIFDNSLPMDKYYVSSFLSGQSLPKILQKKGWVIELFGSSGSIVYGRANKELYSNLSSSNNKVAISIQKEQEANRLLYATYFKFVFHQLKQNFIVDESVKYWDYWFLNILKNKEIKIIEKPVFSITHLQGTHPPFIIMDDYTYSNKATSLTQTKATGNYLKKFFDLLKENNVYDNSVIIVVGDHGHYDKRSNPALLIKNKFQTNDEVTANSTPLSQIQMKDIISKLQNKEYETTNDIKGMDNRKLYIRELIPIRGQAIIEEYEIPDNVRDINNYKKTGVKFYPNIFKLDNKDLSINLSTDYDKYKEIFNPYWSYSDGAVTPTFKMGRKGSLAFQFNDKDKDIIKISFKNSKESLCNRETPIIIGTNSNFQEVSCIDDKIVVYALYDKFLEVSFEPYLLEAPITFDSIDIQHNIPIKEVFKIPYGKLINISSIPDLFFGTGWQDNFFDIKGKGRWTDSEESELQFVLESMPKNDIKISLNVATLNHANYVKPDISFYINDKLIHTDEKGSGFYNKKIDLVVKKEDITDEVVNLKIKYHDKLKSPEEIGISSDIRKLGIYLKNITIEELDKATIQ